MPGLLGIIGYDKERNFVDETRIQLQIDRIEDNENFVERRTINKFLGDKPFFQDQNYIIAVEGVMLNRNEIEKKYKVDHFKDAIISSYEKNGETFFNEFRGSFSGFLYDKRNDLWLIYTDHIGDKQFFYLDNGNEIVFGSEMKFLVDYCKQNRISLSINEQAAYMILTYGFFIENHTIVSEIKKVNAGHYLKIKNKNLEVVNYHEFNNDPDYSLSNTDIIEGIDTYFRNAVKLQFDKDLEYGYNHITTLSGGLDSRMTIWVANDIGYNNITNTTFSQTNYLDETIAKKLSTDLKNDFLFKSLDHGKFLENVDDITEITYGSAIYYGLAHGKSLYDIINFSNFGIVHTGMIGDSIIGTFYKQPIHGTKFNREDGAYSITLLNKMDNYKFQYDYPNQEIFLLYTRAFTGANQGLLEFQERTESLSPFCDVDFINFCYSIPVEHRYGHKIYFDWILNKYPGASNYTWEKTGRKITDKEPYVKLLGKKIPRNNWHKYLVRGLFKKVGISLENKKGDPMKTSFHMNPLDLWYNNSDQLKNFINRYFQENLAFIENNNLKDDCRFLFEKGTVSEKIQVLTLLSAAKIIQK